MGQKQDSVLPFLVEGMYAEIVDIVLPFDTRYHFSCVLNTILVCPAFTPAVCSNFCCTLESFSNTFFSQLIFKVGTVREVFVSRPGFLACLECCLRREKNFECAFNYNGV